MPQRDFTPATYGAILVVLLVLTVLTLSLSFLDMGAPAWHTAVGLAIAVVKATLVVLFFMHVLHSDRLTWMVVAVAVFWLGFFLLMTLGDYFTRGIFNYPGH